MRRKKVSKVAKVTATVTDISKALSAFLPRELLQAGILADLVDIQDICLSYLIAVDMAVKKQSTAEEFEEFLRYLDIELLEHLPFHIRSLRKQLPKAILVVSGVRNKGKLKTRFRNQTSKPQKSAK